MSIYLKDEVLIRKKQTPKRYQDAVLWTWLEMLFIAEVPILNQHNQFILSPVILLHLNTLNYIQQKLPLQIF